MATPPVYLPHLFRVTGERVFLEKADDYLKWCAENRAVTGGVPEGMGDPCAKSEECLKAASHCAYDPARGGMCTLRDCTASPETCPWDYRCFDGTSFGMPLMCIPEANWNDMICPQSP